MQISTIHNGTLIAGVILKHTPFFLEVAITSPFSKISTSRRMPTVLRKHRRYEGVALEHECEALLIELYEIASVSINRP